MIRGFVQGLVTLLPPEAKSLFTSVYLSVFIK